MPRAYLVTMLFRDGGPWDGYELVGQAPPDQSYRLEGGTYDLRETKPATESYSGHAVAVYTWVADRRR
jgi:hypothetical protein